MTKRDYAVPIMGHTRLVGLFGWPVEHSVSPPMHNAALNACGLDWAYIPFAVHPGAIREALEGVRALGLRGVNATVPHKQTLLPLVDELTPAARAIQAVNTVIIDDGHITGHNTDARGFLRALADAGFDPVGKRALMLGAGGAARAAAYALSSSGAQLTILNRTAARAEALASDMRAALPGAKIGAGPLTEDEVEASSQGVDLVVNATSLGMWPHVERSPWPELPFPADALLFDMIYNPRQTRLMDTAQRAGARAIDGLRMLVHQGAEAFTLWTGVEAPVDVMLQACIDVLGGR